jgi:hypothetical protein
MAKSLSAGFVMDSKGNVSENADVNIERVVHLPVFSYFIYEVQVNIMR